MSRLSPLTEADLTPEQREVLDAVASSPRGVRGLVGPFGCYVRAPVVGNAAQALGAAVRYGTSIPENVKEVTICTVGAFYRSRFEFAAHAALAAKAGVDDAVIESLRVGDTPDFSDPAEAVAHRIAATMLAEHRIDDTLYQEGLDRFGEHGMMELVATIGHYCLVSMTLNIFEVPLREGMKDPFPDL